MHFRLMLAHFSRPFSSRYFNTNFGAFWGGTPPLPGGSRRQGRGAVGTREYCIWGSGWRFYRVFMDIPHKRLRRGPGIVTEVTYPKLPYRYL